MAEPQRPPGEEVTHFVSKIPIRQEGLPLLEEPYEDSKKGRFVGFLSKEDLLFVINERVGVEGSHHEVLVKSGNLQGERGFVKYHYCKKFSDTPRSLSMTFDTCKPVRKTLNSFICGVTSPKWQTRKPYEPFFVSETCEYWSTITFVKKNLLAEA